MNERKYYSVKDYEKLKNKRIRRIILIIILILIIVLTGFRTGQKFYEIKNTNLDSVNTNVNSSIAKWNFKVKIIY